MANRRLNMLVSLTETRQYRRLVMFLNDIERLAVAEDDKLLLALVVECRAELMEMQNAGDH